MGGRGGDSATVVPEPRCADRYPSLKSRSYVATAVFLDTPRLAARARVDGRRMPGLRRPSRIANRNLLCSELNSARDPRRGSVIGSGDSGPMIIPISGPYGGPHQVLSSPTRRR